MHDDLREAALRALAVLRERALARAREFEWHAVCGQFIDHLVPAVRALPPAVTKGTQKLHKLGT